MADFDVIGSCVAFVDLAAVEYVAAGFAVADVLVAAAAAVVVVVDGADVGIPELLELSHQYHSRLLPA